MLGSIVKNLLLALVIAVAVYGGLAALLGRTELLARIFGPPDRAAVDFATLERRTSPNDFLACPPGLCARATADVESPVLARSPDETRIRFLAMVDLLPRARLVAADPALDQYDVVETSRLLGFPDTVTVRVLPAGENGSTVAVYSRSHYGHSDLGVNARRVRAWLDFLEQRP